MNDRSLMVKVMEYMAMGRPIVQFPLAEMRRVCADASVYADENDPRDLARKIVELLDDPEQRSRLGEAARARLTEVGLTWPQQVADPAARSRSRPCDSRRARIRAGSGRRDTADHRGDAARASGSGRRLSTTALVTPSPSRLASSGRGSGSSSLWCF